MYIFTYVHICRKDIFRLRLHREDELQQGQGHCERHMSSNTCIQMYICMYFLIKAANIAVMLKGNAHNKPGYNYIYEYASLFNEKIAHASALLTLITDMLISRETNKRMQCN